MAKNNIFIKRIFMMFIFIFLIPLADYFIKLHINANFVNSCEMNTFVPFLKITRVENFGVAFGIFKNHNFIVILLTIAILISIFAMVYIKKIRENQVLVAISFIIGGAIGNLIDRLIYGYVVDYLKLTFFPPVCNLSDYFICIGAVFLIFYYFKNQN